MYVCILSYSVHCNIIFVHDTTTLLLFIKVFDNGTILSVILLYMYVYFCLFATEHNIFMFVDLGRHNKLLSIALLQDHFLHVGLNYRNVQGGPKNRTVFRSL